MFKSKDKITIIKNRYSCDSVQNKKITEFISSPSLNGLTELEKFLECTVSFHENKMYTLPPPETPPLGGGTSKGLNHP